MLLLGFHIPISNSNSNSERMIKEESSGSGDKFYYIENEKNPNFFQYAKKYFYCQNIKRIIFDLDEDNNLHWPSRLFLGDIMADFDCQEEFIISKFTLKFLEDLPYIQVTKDISGGLMKFGKHKGCRFLSRVCGNFQSERQSKEASKWEDVSDLKQDYIFSNEFYLSNIDTDFPKPSCSSGRLSKSVYKLQPFSGNNCEYKISNDRGEYLAGPKSTNYCPIAQFKDNNDESISYRTGLCSDDSTVTEEGYDEEFGNGSFCALRALSNDKASVRAVCYNMTCSDKSLTIKVGDYYIVCPRSGGKIKPYEIFNGYLLCPDYNLICSGTKMCNNYLDCIEQQSQEKENSFDYDEYGVGILTSQNYETYSNQEIHEAWELSGNGFCPENCRYCDQSKKCIKWKVDNCQKYDENRDCKECDENFVLVSERLDGKGDCRSKYEYQNYNTYYYDKEK